jgi:hypothetical protein
MLEAIVEKHTFASLPPLPLAANTNLTLPCFYLRDDLHMHIISDNDGFICLLRISHLPP